MKIRASSKVYYGLPQMNNQKQAENSETKSAKKKNIPEVLEEIKADPKLKQIPVVMLTTSDREADIVKSYASGASSFITKPVGLENLKKVVQQLGLYWAVVAKIPHSPE